MKIQRPSLFAALLLIAAASPASGQHDFHTFHQAEGVEKLDYDSLASDAAPISESAAGRDLAEACLARYGGEERLREVEALRLVYEVTSMFSEAPLEITKTFRPDRQYRIRRPDETRILNGPEAWHRKGENQIDVDGGRYRAELFSFLSIAMPLAMKTERFDGEIRYGERGGDPLGYFYMEKADSLMIVLGVDPETHLIMNTEGVVRQGDQSFVFIHRLSDHEDVDGIPFAWRIVTISMGLEVADARLRNVDINPSFEAGEFRP